VTGDRCGQKIAAIAVTRHPNAHQSAPNIPARNIRSSDDRNCR